MEFSIYVSMKFSSNVFSPPIDSAHKVTLYGYLIMSTYCSRLNNFTWLTKKQMLPLPGTPETIELHFFLEWKPITGMGIHRNVSEANHGTTSTTAETELLTPVAENFRPISNPIRSCVWLTSVEISFFFLVAERNGVVLYEFQLLFSYEGAFTKPCSWQDESASINWIRSVKISTKKSRWNKSSYWALAKFLIRSQ